MDVDPGILLPHQLIDPLQKELPELPLDPVHHHSIDILIWPESGTLQWFLEVTQWKIRSLWSLTPWNPIQCRVLVLARVT